MNSRIYLIGFMGSGKSTLGSSLARKTGYNYLDMDNLIEETAGMTIPQIFAEHGEAVFRKWEHDILIEISSQEHVVISTGGGAPCHGKMMEIMNASGITVYLKLPPAALKKRLLQSKTERPLIQGKSEIELEQFIGSLLKEREVYYTQARYVVDGMTISVDELQKLLGLSLEHPR